MCHQNHKNHQNHQKKMPEKSKKRGRNTERQTSDMIGAGDNSNHGFWLVTDCTKLPTIGMVGWDCGLSTNMFLDLAKSIRDNVQCTYMIFFNRLYQIGTG